MASATGEQGYDRLKQVKQFDESKIGVKGLVDSGVTTIPNFFHQPPENLPGPKPKNQPKLTVPVIDLSRERSTIIEEIRQSASALGFFQIINHNIPTTLIDSVLNDLKSFFEQPTEYKMQFYHREIGKGAAYSTNFDLYQSKAASWRDTLQVRMAPMEPAWEPVPEMCRAALADWDKAVVGLAEELMSILCKGLGVKSDRFKGLSFLEARVDAAHYYPKCPQPDLTVGLTPHTDPVALTILVQNDDVGGLLQVKSGDDWADVEAVHGAIVINIGDLIQIVSNDEYKSVEHRVLANPVEGARVSLAVFFNPSDRNRLLGPLPELVSAEKPAVFKEFTYEDCMGRYFRKALDIKTITNLCKIDNKTG